LSSFNSDETKYIHCRSGYRSVIAGSILKSRGIHNIVDMLGGFTAIKDTDVPTTTFACQSKV
jgi:rhodanese-related sulfurtransferase